MADANVGEIKVGSSTSTATEARVSLLLTDNGDSLSPPAKQLPPARERLRPKKSTSSLQVLGDSVDSPHCSYVSLKCSDLHTPFNRVSEPLSPIPALTHYSPSVRMVALTTGSRPVLHKSHSVAYGADCTLSLSDSTSPHIFLLQEISEASNLTVSGVRTEDATSSDSGWLQQDSLGFQVTPTSDTKLLRRSQSQRFDGTYSTAEDVDFATTPGGRPSDSRRRRCDRKWRHSCARRCSNPTRAGNRLADRQGLEDDDVTKVSSSSPPPLGRQWSRRRSYQQTTSTTSTCLQQHVHADSSQRGKGEEEESPQLSAPGTPRPAKAPRMQDSTNITDPYQVFEVQHLPCIILKVRVVRGRNITNGWRDHFDTPDPYIKLRIKTAPDGRQRTRTIDDEVNPIWNETFTFFLAFSEDNILELTLMEANPFNFDQEIATVHFNVHERICEFGKWQREVFNFSGTQGESEIDVDLHMEWDQKPTLRYSLCLSEAEKEFMKKRKQKVWLALNTLLGDQGPQTADEAPTIAVLGSGGGFRAMTAFSGVFSALADSGLLDCVTYACGLSGSAWYLSTLYSHPRWPEMNAGEMQSELMNNMDKSLMRLLGPHSVLRYLSSVITKRRQGQPVSFTDFFGHMVGETLLRGRLDSRLTDQRAKIAQAEVPMPLYTCVHVKKDVPARSFQEWVEFSPYEIGMPKYGTFMDSSLFGSKFFMGKLVSQYQEPPLHFLQGIWGSAFCILFKRLLEDNRNLDPAEMIRQEMGQQLEEHQQTDDSSDISDDSDNETETESSDNSEEQNTEKLGQGRQSASFVPELPSSPQSSDGEGSIVDLQPPKFLLSQRDCSAGFEDVDMPQVTEQEQRVPLTPTTTMPRSIRRECSHSQEKGAGSCSPQGTKKGVRFSQLVNEYELTKAHQHLKRTAREAVKKAPSCRRSKSSSCGYWKSVLKGMLENQHLELLSTRAGRAAVIHNFMRGLSLQQTYPLSPFTPLNERVQVGDEFDGIFDMYPTHIKHIYMVDAGLTFNSPFPLVLRPQRGVDVILSFDFSARPSDSTPPFKELLLAEKWAKLNRLPFPPIDPTVVDREGLKELYVFQDPKDPHCPIVLHFVLVNITFRQFKAPGVPRETKEEMDFADFDIFDDPSLPYSTFNFTYSHQQFQRLSQLTYFNTLYSMDSIKQVLAQVVACKKQVAPRMPTEPSQFKLLRMKSVQEKRQLKKFLKKMESRGKLVSTPPTPFFTPAPDSTMMEENPFVFSTKSDSSTSLDNDVNPFFYTLRQNSQTKLASSSTGSKQSNQAGNSVQQTTASRKPSVKDISRSLNSKTDDVFHRISSSESANDRHQTSSQLSATNDRHQTSSQLSATNDRHQTSSQLSAINGRHQISSQLSATSSDEEFFDAAEAFTRDGEPVTNSHHAKMHYESAKQRRRLLRRQSTISNLNSSTKSISLDSAEDSRKQSGSSLASFCCPYGIDVASLEQFEGIADNDQDKWLDPNKGRGVGGGMPDEGR